MSITTRAAICFELNTPWQIEEIELDPPKAGEVLVRMGGSGLCHSDEHIVTGDLPWPLPMIGGHEGAAVIEEVGPGVTSVAPGDRVIFGFIPACGRCPSCSSGHQNLCDLGMYMARACRSPDHTARHHRDGQDLDLMCMLGTFAERTVINEANCIKIGDDIPLDVACLLGCGVGTGWGAAVNTGEVAARDTVVVVGIGGIGINAVQGARWPAPSRPRDRPGGVQAARRRWSSARRTPPRTGIPASTCSGAHLGPLANVVINTKGLGEGADIAAALRLAGKRGKVVVTNLHNAAEATVAMSALDLVLMEKQVRGSLFGSSNPRADIPRMLDLYRNGKLKLDELATHRYKLEEVNQGYDDMRAGRSLRGVITF